MTIPVCLTIATVSGIYCYDNAPPIGHCIYQPDVIYCAAPPDLLSIRPSYYDPFIETDNPAVAALQCQEPCAYLGDGTPVAEAYDLYMACVPGWYGRTVYIDGIGTRQCRDSGGAVVPTYGRTYDLTADGELVEVWTWWLTVDILTKEQPAAAYDLRDWYFVEPPAVEFAVDTTGGAQ